MNILVTTENGSIYEVDDEARLWRQVKSTSRSGLHRSTHGRILELDQIAIGEPLVIRDDNTLPDHTHHYLKTSLVVKVGYPGKHPWDCKCEWHV